MQFQYLIFVFLINPIDNICLLNIKYGKGMYGKLISKYDTPDWSGKSDITFVRSNEFKLPEFADQVVTSLSIPGGLT